jgi:hypothetical protein
VDRRGRVPRSAAERGFAQRFRGELSADGDMIEGAWEKADDDGSDWEHDFTLVYRRVA